MSSAIKVHQEVLEIFTAVKLRHEHKYVLFKINDEKTHIVIDEKAEKIKTEEAEEDAVCFKEMAEKLKTEEPRYILYDFGFKTKGGRKLEKLAFGFWCDDEALIKKKMIYASSKDYIKKAFSGVSLEFQFNDKADLDYNVLMKEVEKKA